MPLTTKGTPYVVSTDLVANYPTVSSDLADHIDDNLTYNAQTINAQTGTTYTFALADATLYKLVTATNAAASTYTIPPQSSVTWVDGSVLRILNQGAGTVTLTPGSGVTLNGATLSLSQYQYAELHRTASNTWTVTGISSPPGLTLITSSTFTAQASVSINNCFTSTYRNYRIIFDNVFIASGIDIRGRMRLRAGGTDDSTSNYQDGRRGISTGGTFDDLFATGKTSFEFILNFSGADRTFCSVDVYAPQVADRTAYTASAVTFDAMQLAAGRFNAATQFDGFTFFPASSTATGTLYVYGYRS